MNNSQKRILLINEGYSDNFGDQIIKDSLIYLINKIGFNACFEDLTRHRLINNYDYSEEIVIKKTTFLTPIKSIVWKILWLMKNLKRLINISSYKYDAVVVGGGQLLLSNGIFPFALFIWVNALSLRNNKNIILFSVGTQGSYSKFQKFLLSRTLKKIEHIYVRDKISKDILAKEFNKDSIITYDTAFIFDSIYEVTKNDDRYKYLIGVVDFRVYTKYKNGISLSQNEYFDSWISYLDDVNDLYKSALIYATPEDRLECLKLKEYIKEKFQIEIDILENSNYSVFLDNLSQGSMIISGRMHSLILSKVLRKQIKGYPISEKVSSFLDIINGEDDLQTIQETLIDDFKSAITRVSQN